MMINADSIIVCCPGGSVSGGPELLHQLVDTLRRIGRRAYVAYYPFDASFSCPLVYEKYNTPQTNPSNLINSFVIVPETAVWILKQIPHTNAAVWWLSVDNYFYALHDSLLRDLYMRYRSLLGLRLPLKRLKCYRHLVQSKYAADFLENAGIESVVLSDYLSDDYLVQRVERVQRNDIIVFNPKKGYRKTIKLREMNPDFEFVAIENMTPQQVADIFSRAKLYIDFGHHPGKDRLPREAAMMGCCIITGRQGSANFYEDISIPNKYKLDDSSKKYLYTFRPLVKNIFENYQEHINEFSNYRSKIANEPSLFIQQANQIFGIEP